MKCDWCTPVTDEELDEQTPTQLVSTITQGNDLHDFMQDPQVDRAMDIVVKLMSKPDVPAAKAILLITELQAMSTHFAVEATRFQTIAAGPARSDNAHKKNLYKTLNAAIDRLVDALKFSAKQGLYG